MDIQEEPSPSAKIKLEKLADETETTQLPVERANVSTTAIKRLFFVASTRWFEMKQAKTSVKDYHQVGFFKALQKCSETYREEHGARTKPCRDVLKE